ncbi:hypothetical protein BAZ12_18080 [Elizabethkingia miricola]|uniref:Uncharacterized protein n=2 Tax=Weeksellaceae TaxID=2762318 RepID=A0ABD4DLV9_ELIMR|nr:hypothetical protein ATB95_12885 [Elizabethkingia miricola]OPC72567.1 hypothetical protein BAZ13_05655 [Elizabethkingia miricola]OPC76381.1 hypothetical protein BAZ12_18080 [Elizabethkingia miricola]QCO48697.1 hypothetical protein FCS00_16050 [Elizabethkingia sp. 2-6]
MSCMSITSAQKYILLDGLQVKPKEYTLKTKDLYGIDKKISIYNIFISNNKILLFSVLPQYDAKTYRTEATDYEKLTKVISTTKVENYNDQETDWEKIDYDKIKDKIKEVWNIESDIMSIWGWDITPEKKTFEYQIVKKLGKDYYAAKNCLTEVFNIETPKYPIATPYGTINIIEPKVTIKEMLETFKKQYPKSIFPLDIWEKSQSRGGDGIYTVRNYLSKEYKVKNDNAYQFWTLDSWWSMHGDNHHRGIDRFVYIPEKGIIGGSYDFYFRNPRGFRIADTVLWQNIINEKVMIAEELK